MNRRERRAAQASKKASKGPSASTPAELRELAHRHMQAGRYLDAQLCCRQALAAEPDHAETLHLMGLLHLKAGQYDHAIEWIDRAGRQDPRTDYLGSLGIALEQQGLNSEAVKALDRALQLRPDDIALRIYHGNALAKLDRFLESLVSYQRVLKLNPVHPDAVFGSGCVLLKLGRLDEALSYIDLRDQMHPNQAVVLEQRGLVLFGMKRYEEALSNFLRAHALNPTNHETCNNIGSTLQLLSRDGEALEWFDKAIALLPDCMTALVNKAFTLTQLRRLDEAFATFRHAQSIDPDDAGLTIPSVAAEPADWKFRGRLGWTRGALAGEDAPGVISGVSAAALAR